MIPHALVRPVGGRRVTPADFRRWRELAAASAPPTLPPAAIAAFTDPDGVHGVADLSFEVSSNRFGVPGTVTLNGSAFVGADAIATVVDGNSNPKANGHGRAGDALRRVDQPRPLADVVANSNRWDFGTNVAASHQEPVNSSPASDPDRLAWLDPGRVWVVNPNGRRRLTPSSAQNWFGAGYRTDSNGHRTMTVVVWLAVNASTQVTLAVENLGVDATVALAPAVTLDPVDDGTLTRVSATIRWDNGTGVGGTFKPRPVVFLDGAATRVEFADVQIYAGDERSDAAGLSVALPPEAANFTITFPAPRTLNQLEAFGRFQDKISAVSVRELGGASPYLGVGDGPDVAARWEPATSTGVIVGIEEAQMSELGVIAVVELDPSLVYFLDDDLVECSVEWARESDPAQVTSPFGNYEASTLNLVLDNTDGAWSPESNPALDLGHRVTCALGVRYSNQLPNPRFDLDLSDWITAPPQDALGLGWDADGVPYFYEPGDGFYVDVDDDGTPYFADTLGDHPLFLDDDGTPFFRSSESDLFLRIQSPGDAAPSRYSAALLAEPDETVWAVSTPILTGPGSKWRAESWVQVFPYDPYDDDGFVVISVIFLGDTIAYDPLDVLDRVDVLVPMRVNEIFESPWQYARTAEAVAPAGTTAVRFEVTVRGASDSNTLGAWTRAKLTELDDDGKPIEAEALVPAGVFFTDPYDTESDSETVSITALDRLGRFKDVNLSETVIERLQTITPIYEGGELTVPPEWDISLQTVVAALTEKYLDASDDQVVVDPSLEALFQACYLWGTGPVGTYLADLAKSVGGSLHVDVLDRVVIEPGLSATEDVVTEFRGDNALIRYTRPPGYDTTSSRVKVNATPLAEGAPLAVWDLPEGGVIVPQGQAITLVCPYSQTPVIDPSVTGVVADKPSGEYTITPTFYGDRAEIRIHFLTLAGPPLVVADLHVTATPLIETPLSGEAVDDKSLKRYGDRVLEVSARMIQTREQVQAVADLLLDAFRSIDDAGVRRLPDLTLDGMGLPHITAGDRVIVDTPAGYLSEAFVVLGRRLSFSNTGSLLFGDVRVRSTVNRTVSVKGYDFPAAGPVSPHWPSIGVIS